MCIRDSDPAAPSRAFQDFMREANRGQQIRFCATREAAIRWLNAS